MGTAPSTATSSWYAPEESVQGECSPLVAMVVVLPGEPDGSQDLQGRLRHPA